MAAVSESEALSSSENVAIPNDESLPIKNIVQTKRSMFERQLEEGDGSEMSQQAAKPNHHYKRPLIQFQSESNNRVVERDSQNSLSNDKYLLAQESRAQVTRFSSQQFNYNQNISTSKSDITSSNRNPERASPNQKSVDAPVSPNQKSVDAPVSPNQKSVDAPVSSNQKSVDAPVSSNQKSVDAPVSPDQKSVGASSLSNQKSMDTSSLSNQKPAYSSLSSYQSRASSASSNRTVSTGKSWYFGTDVSAAPKGAIAVQLKPKQHQKLQLEGNSPLGTQQLQQNLLEEARMLQQLDKEESVKSEKLADIQIRNKRRICFARDSQLEQKFVYERESSLYLAGSNDSVNFTVTDDKNTAAPLPPSSTAGPAAVGHAASQALNKSDISDYQTKVQNDFKWGQNSIGGDSLQSSGLVDNDEHGQLQKHVPEREWSAGSTTDLLF